MDPATQLNDILNEIERRMCALFEVEPDQVFEYRETGTQQGTALYISAAVTEVKPATMTTEEMTVEVALGFHIPEDAEKGNRVYRIERQSALRDQIVFVPNHPDKIPNIKLEKTTTMGMTFGDDPDEGYLMGGITVSFTTFLNKKKPG